MLHKWLFFVLLLSVPVIGQNLLVNGDFESGSVGWSQWWGGNSGVGVPDPIDGDLCGGVWWSDDGIFQGIAIGPGTYTISGQLSHENLGNNRIGVIRAEVGNGTDVWWVQQIVISASDPAGTWISGSTIIDNTTAGAAWLNINLFLIDQSGTGTGIVRYDNISVTSDDEAPLNNPNYNSDNKVDHLDFAELSGAWKQESATHNLSGNAVIDLEDLALFASAWLTIIPEYAGYELVWSDEFYGTQLTMENWSYQIMGDGGNGELQYYTSRPENSWVSGGNLVIQANEEDYYAGGQTYHYTSARLRTAGKQDFLYGRIEARIKVPTGGGMWPAFWMMPTESVYGGWAASGEIDIMETNNDTDFIQGTLFYGGEYPDQDNTYVVYYPGDMDFSDDYHVYALEWEPDMMKWYVDDVHYSTKISSQWYSDAAPGNDRAPFDQAFHILLNVAVGGSYTGCTNPVCITAAFPQQMLIDWVRVYQKTSP